MKSRIIYAGVVVVCVALIAFGIGMTKHKSADVVIGKYEPPDATTTTKPTVTVPAPDLGGVTIPVARYSASLLSANGQAYGRALGFNSKIALKEGLVFFLVVGSDARPGENLHKTRTDSIHVMAVDPSTKSGTIVGIPRDTYVEIPGYGEHKINEAMERGGPQLMMQTLRNFTGLPIEYYVITGFEGFSQIVDELGGVDVYVPTNMNDKYSGARFAQGYHHFDGEQALAFCRDRHDVKYGDFTRSENQGRLVLATLAKMRADVEDDAGLHKWLSVLSEHAELDVPMAELDGLAALARRLDPESLNNVVMPGKTGTAKGGQSVVFAGDSAAALWGDLRDDARLTNAPAGPANEGSVDNGNGGTTETTSYDETTTTTSYDEPTTTTTSGGDLLGG